jgi:hypothetical protein
MRILAVDPGETTGFVRAEIVSGAVYQDVGDLIRDSKVHFNKAGTLSGKRELAANVGLFSNLDVCVVEKYVIYPNRAMQHIGDDLYTARMIGQIEWLAYVGSSIDDVVFQAASQAKQRWPDSRLYKYLPGLKGKTEHIKDAVRHLLTYVEVNGG